MGRIRKLASWTFGAYVAIGFVAFGYRDCASGDETSLLLLPIWPAFFFQAADGEGESGGGQAELGGMPAFVFAIGEKGDATERLGDCEPVDSATAARQRIGFVQREDDTSPRVYERVAGDFRAILVQADSKADCQELLDIFKSMHSLSGEHDYSSAWRVLWAARAAILPAPGAAKPLLLSDLPPNIAAMLSTLRKAVREPLDSEDCALLLEASADPVNSGRLIRNLLSMHAGYNDALATHIERTLGGDNPQLDRGLTVRIQEVLPFELYSREELASHQQILRAAADYYSRGGPRDLRVSLEQQRQEMTRLAGVVRTNAKLVARTFEETEGNGAE